MKRAIGPVTIDFTLVCSPRSALQTALLQVTVRSFESIVWGNVATESQSRGINTAVSRPQRFIRSIGSTIFSADFSQPTGEYDTSQ